MKSKVLLLELNELNFEFIEWYARKGRLPAFKHVLEVNGYQQTTSETEYSNLEPWIQWVTAHTGLDFHQHSVFRLGDIVDHDLSQIWEELEEEGLTVGAISPMNARQRMREPAFFLPDPWTNTPIIAPWLARRFYRAAALMVNENAANSKRLLPLLDLALGSSYCLTFNNYWRCLKYAISSRSRKWRKALILDLLLSDLFIKLVKESRVDFATLFLNAAAHIQHHYMFSSLAYSGPLRNPEWYVGSADDPLLDVYELYDHILASVTKALPDYRVLIATGLHQVPYSEQTFYWRLRDHKAFLKKIGLESIFVSPRMSRDFLVECQDAAQAAVAAQRLQMVSDMERVPLFEIDNRGSSLFVTLTYPHEITRETNYLVGNEQRSDLMSEVAFVAIKNGHHDGVGYFTDTGKKRLSPATSFPLKELPVRIKDALL